MSICSLQGKSFQALLNALTKKIFFGKHEITYELITEELFQGTETDSSSIKREIRAIEKLLEKISTENLDLSRAESTLLEFSLSPEQTKIFLNFWSTEKDKIISSLIKSTVYNDQYKSLSWRVDVKSASRSSVGLDEPIAIFDLETVSLEGVNKVSKFEMDTSEIKNMISSFNDISKAFEKVLNNNNINNSSNAS